MESPGNFLKIGNRKVFYRVYGDGKHKFFFHHGFPGSSLQAGFIAPFTQKLDVSVCSFDRPGYGNSDFDAKIGFEQVADTVGAIARALGWKRYHQFAVSGGTPFALAASSLPGTTSCSLVGPLGPIHRREFRRHLPLPTRLLMRLTNPLPSAWLDRPVRVWQDAFNKEPEKSLRESSVLSAKDKEILLSPANQQKLQLSMDEAFRQGPQGPHHDVRLFQRPWRFRLEQLRCPVHLWHGTDDKILPARFSELLKEMIPNSTLNMVEGEGHYSLPIGGIEQIVGKVLDK